MAALAFSSMTLPLTQGDNLGLSGLIFGINRNFCLFSVIRPSWGGFIFNLLQTHQVACLVGWFSQVVTTGR